MNIQRGLFRIWVIATLTWLAFSLWMFDFSCFFGSHPWCNWWSSSTYVAFGPPVLAFAAIWAAKGGFKDIGRFTTKWVKTEDVAMLLGWFLVGTGGFFFLIGWAGEFALSLIGFFIWVAGRLFYWRYLELNQQRRDANALDLFNAVRSGAQSTFCVFLRPFYVTDKIVITDEGRWISFEWRLVKALEEMMPVLCLGKPGETVGVARILSDEITWKRTAEELIGNGSLIICMPSMRPGSQWELDHLLREGCLSKTIFVMPNICKTIGSREIRTDWAGLREYVSQNGFSFPKYKCRGLLFAINNNRECMTRRFSFSPWFLRRGIENLRTFANKA